MSNQNSPAHAAALECEWTDTAGAAKILGISRRALDARRCYKGHAPPHAKIGRLVRYHIPSLRAWALAQLVTPSADASATEGGAQ